MTTETNGGANALSQKFYMSAWRWHFYAGLYVIPFMITLAVTGLMMMYINLFDGRDGEKITVTPTGEAMAASTLSDAVLAAQPGTIAEWIGPKSPDLATVFRVKTETGNRMVAIDQYSGEIIETWDRRVGWYDFADNIHSDLLIGTTGDRLIEIAAGLGLVLVATGLYMWWPRGGDTSILIPNLRARGRSLWKSLHESIGFWMSILMVVFLLSGLSWAGVWGGKFVQPWSSFPAAKWDNVPLSDSTHASMNHGHTNDVPWALEQTPMPASGSDAGQFGIPEGAPVNIDSLIALGQSLGLPGRFRVAYPGGETGVWTINRDSMSSDSTDPFSDTTIHVDQYTGKILADVRYADYSAMGKTMAVSVPFHMGLMGLWNLALNTLFCLSVIFISLSGVVMWVKRRPARTARLAAPPTPAQMPHWKGAVLVGLFLSLAFPLAGLTFLGVFAFDLLILNNIAPLRRALS